MLKLKILSVGKTKESWLEEAISEYIKRLTGVLQFEFIWAKDDKQLLILAQKERHLIALDPEGTQFTSNEFSRFFMQQVEAQGGRITFVIGGAEGLPKELDSSIKISLSKLTFTHQMTRLILVEQVYRALEIAKGSSYNK